MGRPPLRDARLRMFLRGTRGRLHRLRHRRNSYDRHIPGYSRTSPSTRSQRSLRALRLRRSGGEGGIRERPLFTLSETLVESKRTRDESLLFCPAPPLQPGLYRPCFPVTGTLSGPHHAYRETQTRMLGPLSGVVLFLAVGYIGRDTDVIAMIGTFQDIAGPALRLAHSARSGHSACGGVAERVGFEPTVEFPQHSLSRRALSTAQTPLRGQDILAQRAHESIATVTLIVWRRRIPGEEKRTPRPARRA